MRLTFLRVGIRMICMELLADNVVNMIHNLYIIRKALQTAEETVLDFYRVC